jgi:hypothetical protein
MLQNDSDKIIINDPLTGLEKEITRTELEEMLAKGIYIDKKSIKNK